MASFFSDTASYFMEFCPSCRSTDLQSQSNRPSRLPWVPSPALLNLTWPGSVALDGLLTSPGFESAGFDWSRFLVKTNSSFLFSTPLELIRSMAQGWKSTNFPICTMATSEALSSPSHHDKMYTKDSSQHLLPISPRGRVSSPWGSTTHILIVGNVPTEHWRSKQTSLSFLMSSPRAIKSLRMFSSLIKKKQSPLLTQHHTSNTSLFWNNR